MKAAPRADYHKTGTNLGFLTQTIVLMAPTRTKQKALRRLSSPLLPHTILPSIQSRQAARNTELRHAAEEDERAFLNKVVYRLGKDAAASPNDEVIAATYHFKREDYEEQYGKYIPDAENADWFSRKERMYLDLLDMRAQTGEAHLNDGLFLADTLLEHFSHLHHRAELWAYFDAVHAYEQEFGLAFEVDDVDDHTFRMKRKVLVEFDRLMSRHEGDVCAALEAAGRPFTFSVANLFAGNDERRVDFDMRRSTRTIGWIMQCRATPPSANISAGRVWYHEVKEIVKAARKEAALPKSARSTLSMRTFYGHYWIGRSDPAVIGWRPFDGSRPTLWTVATIDSGLGKLWGVVWLYKDRSLPFTMSLTARRSLKCLPSLPASPFDRKITRHRSPPAVAARKLKAKTPLAVRTVIAAQGAYLPHVPAQALTTGEMCERWWTASLPLNYCNLGISYDIASQFDGSAL
ncbi:hypothetical protein DFH09DRAFT_1085513 [Mycena vulgaris]|nr:hypothetical protein DFH09DRAFT_1085513 [Mycena vulgaris]